MQSLLHYLPDGHRRYFLVFDFAGLIELKIGEEMFHSIHFGESEFYTDCNWAD